ncbi:heat shock 70 kDa protein 12B-like isoform X2 [Mercenaria mercenaria]|uniref:heat shock 70 kDa protein 12B-like isoform X2 n=1 Tax=Mercenaria mercenaria TaxID=6596 RepID=UPI00234E499E|nr:heat shock 70 kDa protein 12B-like isoform X2 [Mercenaria mercenaria]
MPEAVIRPKQLTQTIIPHKKSNALLVAAIDFGTTYTGFGYSFKNNPDHFFANWHGGMEQLQEKIPTAVLMNPKKEFHSFGHEANKTYMQLVQENKHQDWYYFNRFKMKLFVKQEPLTKDMEIEDFLGKPMIAMEVFTAAIKYIREHMLTILNDPDRKDLAINGITDIHWVLTIPAIWDDLSKHFMREAAQQAGIPSDMLTLALEPEAASLFCKKDLQSTDCRYILIDLGGGTVDITCHEVSSNGSLTELHPPIGGDFGGTSVDNKFVSVLNRIFGADIVHQFKIKYTESYWELMSGFELKKRSFGGSGEVRLKFPLSLVQLYDNIVGESLTKSLEQSTIAEVVQFKTDKMVLGETLMKDLFSSSVKELKQATDGILSKVENIENIILVGGFSESPYIRKMMREHFGNILVLPKSPSIAVLQGAALYGHEPTAISSRKCRYTYGISRMERFNERKHPVNKKVEIGKYTYCDGVFCKHIEIGTEVNVNRPDLAIEHEYFPSSSEQSLAILEVYRSCKKDPVFVDETDCHLVGLIKVQINTKGDIWTKLMVKLIFGGTELIVEVRDEKNSTVTTGSVDFLG